MSMSFELEFVELSAGQWFYIMENPFAPKNSWNWRDNATAYGPFKTQPAADKHFAKNQPSNGGHTITNRKDYEPDEFYATLIAYAVSPEAKEFNQ